jgi:hypothetical protein
VFDSASSTSSKKSKVRFAVGSPEGPRGNVYRLWTTNDEVYLSIRALTGEEKVSLHKSGQWRSAFTEEHIAKGSPFVTADQDRAFDKWTRPPEFAPGLTLAFNIVVPASEVTMPQHPAEANAAVRGTEIVWVPPAPAGYETHFTVLFTTAEATAATLPDWPGRSSMGARLIFRAELANTESVWLVTYEQPMHEEQRQRLEEYKHDVITALKRHRGADAYSKIPEPRGYLYGHNEQGQWRFFIDFSGADEEGKYSSS